MKVYLYAILIAVSILTMCSTQCNAQLRDLRIHYSLLKQGVTDTVNRSADEIIKHFKWYTTNVRVSANQNQIVAVYRKLFIVADRVRSWNYTYQIRYQDVDELCSK